MSTASTDVPVSLEPHLVDALDPLRPILPPNIASALTLELNNDKGEIRFGLLVEISKWCRSDQGAAALKTRNLHPHAYSTVSLLAGTTTSPSSKLSPNAPSDSLEPKYGRDWNDRKALTAVLNGLLSIGCSGTAAWWVADKSGWRNEWKVLLALIVAAVVGVSEVVLFMILQSKRLGRSSPKRTRRILKLDDKKDDGVSPVPSGSTMKPKDSEVLPHEVRQRRTRLQKAEHEGED